MDLGKILLIGFIAVVFLVLISLALVSGRRKRKKEERHQQRVTIFKVERSYCPNSSNVGYNTLYLWKGEVYYEDPRYLDGYNIYVFRVPWTALVDLVSLDTAEMLREQVESTGSIYSEEFMAFQAAMDEKIEAEQQEDAEIRDAVEEFLADPMGSLAPDDGVPRSQGTVEEEDTPPWDDDDSETSGGIDGLSGGATGNLSSETVSEERDPPPRASFREDPVASVVEEPSRSYGGDSDTNYSSDTTTD